MQHKLFIDGQRIDGGPLLQDTHEYSGEVNAAILPVREAQVDAALGATAKAAPVMAEMPAHKRCDFLIGTASL